VLGPQREAARSRAAPHQRTRLVPVQAEQHGGDHEREHLQEAVDVLLGGRDRAAAVRLNQSHLGISMGQAPDHAGFTLALV
jgi:hypothetical protein